MFIAYDVALDLVRALRPVVAKLRTYSADAADQVERGLVVVDTPDGRHGPTVAGPRWRCCEASGWPGQRSRLDSCEVCGSMSSIRGPIHEAIGACM